jgi:hypothetical protein
MPLRFLPNPRLYTDYTYYTAHPEWIDLLGPGRGDGGHTLLYHCYWEGDLLEHHALSLRSLLLTQRGSHEVWVWRRPGTEAQDAGFLDRLHDPRVRRQEYVPAELCRGTVLEDRPELLSGLPPALASDAFRTLVLAQHGGVYFDLDILFLKDMRPLTAVDFFYGWSDQPFGNSAVAHFRPGSPDIERLLERGARLASFHPARLYRYEKLAPLLDDTYVFPTFAFDPAWMAHDRSTTINDYCNRLEDFFASTRPIALDDFFPGSYGYHWHNQWNRPLDPNVMAGRIYEEICARLERAQPAD